jgi:hypothetical protein
MRYARIEENAMDHPKFIALTAGAWRLWCEGNTYCQRQLTDGFIPATAVKGFRYYSAACLKQLLAALVPSKGPLWHLVEGGYGMHDYLDWNESALKVKADRLAAKHRLDKWKAEQAAKRDVIRVSKTRFETLRSTPCDVAAKQNRTEQNVPDRSPGETRTVPDEPAQQIGWLHERYVQLHTEIIGVGYIGNPRADYQEWCALLPTFGCDLLEKLMVYWFNTDDEFTRAGTRTVAKFRSRASKYAEELKAKKLA